MLKAVHQAKALLVQLLGLWQEQLFVAVRLTFDVNSDLLVLLNQLVPAIHLPFLA